MDEQIPNQQAVQQINVSSFAAKFKSKADVYHMLTVEAGKYLPSIDCCTIYWLKDIASGAKKALAGSDITHIA